MQNLLLVLLQSQKMLDERKAKLKVKEVQKQEKEKRLQKLKSQVTDCLSKKGKQQQQKRFFLYFPSLFIGRKVKPSCKLDQTESLMESLSQSHI